MDWNWFFSALAQSTAAIVGIFAAFIITKIINNQTSFNQKKREAARQILNCEYLISRAKNHLFKLYNDRIRILESQYLLPELTRHRNNLPEAREYLESYKEQPGFSPYDDISEIMRVIEKATSALKQEEGRADHQAVDEAIKVMNEGIFLPANASKAKHKLMYTLHKDQQRNFIIEEGRKLDSLRDEIQNHVGRVKQFIDENKEHPESSQLVTWSILATVLLFFVGVIYPLSFLPLDTSKPFWLSLSAFFPLLFSLKGGFLTSISVIFTGIMARFIIINNGLKLNEKTFEDLETYTQYSTYSEYIANYYKNQSDT